MRGDADAAVVPSERVPVDWLSEGEMRRGIDCAVDLLKPLLRLEDYEIVVEVGRLDDAYGESTIHPWNRVATVGFDGSHLGLSIELSMETVFHEMLHVALHPTETGLQQLNRMMVDAKGGYEHTFAGVRHQMLEGQVDRLLMVLTKGLKASCGLDVLEWLMGRVVAEVRGSSSRGKEGVA